MRILLVPGWLGDLHWLVMGGLLWALAVWSWRLYAHASQLRSLLYAIALSSLAAIASLFWLIQIEALPWVDPLLLFALERALWWPLGLALSVLVDMHAAELNGHRSLITRLDRYLTQARGKQ